jgi:hypothetical protein
MECFANLIGVAQSCQGQPGYLSLQTIGITEGLLAQITNEDEAPLTMLSNVERLAQEVVKNDVVTHFGDRIIPRTLVDGIGFGEPSEDGEVLTGTGIGGIVVEAGASNSNQVIRIGSLGVWMPGADDTYTIKVYDLTDGREVASVDIDATGGEITRESVQIALPAARRRTAYFITTDATLFYKVNILPDSGCGSCSRPTNHIGGVDIWAGRIAAATPIRKSNIQSASHTSGLMATITVECDHAALLCEVKDRIALPYLYKVGQLIMDRAIYAFERFNSQTVNKDALQERHDRLGKEYAASITNVLSKMVTPNDPICYICNQKTKTIVGIP